MAVEQGDIIQIEKLKGYFLVVSKDFFNSTEQAIVCPMVKDTFSDPLHIEASGKEVKGIVMCEQMRLVDLRYRGLKRVDAISYSQRINITDAIQGIFDY